MKVWAAVFTALFAVCAVLTAYFFIGGTLMSECRVETAQAADHPDAFRTIVRAAERGEAERVYAADLPQDSAGCVLTRVTIDLRNAGMFEAGWLEAECDGGDGDIVLYEVIGAGEDIPAMGTGTVELRFLSWGRTPRDIRISYYVLGMHRTVTVRAN